MLHRARTAVHTSIPWMMLCMLILLFIGGVHSCANNCSSNGLCRDGVCDCAINYVNTDCSLFTTMPISCPLSTYCMQWRITNDNLYMRIQAMTYNYSGNPG